MIAYKASDVKLSWHHNHPPGEMGAPKTCGYVKEPFEMEGSGNENNNNGDEYLFEEESLWTRTTNNDENKDPNINIAEPLAIENQKKRVKRQSDQYEYTPTKTRCPLLLVADYRFFQEMGGGNTKTTINYLVNEIL